MEVDAGVAEAGGDAGADERLSRRSGAWNKHDDADAAGIFAATQAAGATGVAVRYADISFKVLFEPQGKDPPYHDEVATTVKALQLATASARLEELERRAGGQSTRAQKEKMRKQKQKATKRQAAQGDATGHAQQQQPHGWRAQQQSSGRGAQRSAGAGPRKSAEATAMAEAIAFVTAAATQQPAQSRLARSAFWQCKTWQVIVPVGTVAAGHPGSTTRRWARPSPRHATNSGDSSC